MRSWKEGDTHESDDDACCKHDKKRDKYSTSDALRMAIRALS